ncbi:MAG: Gfo/Idh/MocA family oxidoreductase [Clostridiales bacterium]|jgi:predicted dehydrogenase|nr:Gfo/Idh/MocA family oxidoreductase [Clostridiales bacterium]
MTKIGIIGCGAISGIYLTNLTKLFKEIEIAGVCDLIPERAQKARDEYGVEIYKDMYEIFSDKSIGLILNLTRPYEHFDVDMAAIEAGKHVYSEKPLGADWEEGQKILAAANAKSVLVGGAPDTFMGAGIQTCRKLIDDGYIGKPVGATAFMTCRGHESWHPDPEFYYKFGGGPMMDMGPYYITALVNLLGAVETVSGFAGVSFPTRTITSRARYGEIVKVEVPTNIHGVMRFKSGAIGTIITSFDVHRANLPIIEIYGSEGTLQVPDPNTFGGPVRLFRPERGEFLEFPLMFGYSENSRGLGLADMSKAIETGRKPRAHIDITSHALEIITGFVRSDNAGYHLELTTCPDRPQPMVNGLLPGILD